MRSSTSSQRASSHDARMRADAACAQSGDLRASDPVGIMKPAWKKSNVASNVLCDARTAPPSPVLETKAATQEVPLGHIGIGVRTTSRQRKLPARLRDCVRSDDDSKVDAAAVSLTRPHNRPARAARTNNRSRAVRKKAIRRPALRYNLQARANVGVVDRSKGCAPRTVDNDQVCLEAFGTLTDSDLQDFVDDDLVREVVAAGVRTASAASGASIASTATSDLFKAVGSPKVALDVDCADVWSFLVPPTSPVSCLPSPGCRRGSFEPIAAHQREAYTLEDAAENVDAGLLRRNGLVARLAPQLPSNIYDERLRVRILC